MRHTLAVASLLLGRSLLAQAGCQSFPQSLSDGSIDLAPLEGYVEVCAKDAALCQRLTGGFPPGVQTLGYFVATDEWEAHVRDASKNFAHYLIAQLARGMKPADMPGSRRDRQLDHVRDPHVDASRGGTGAEAATRWASVRSYVRRSNGWGASRRITGEEQVMRGVRRMAWIARPEH